MMLDDIILLFLENVLYSQYKVAWCKGNRLVSHHFFRYTKDQKLVSNIPVGTG